MENEQEKPTVSSPTCTALLCCPFCGSDALLVDLYEINKSTWGVDHDGRFLVECPNGQCHVRSTARTISAEKAIKKWNKRPKNTELKSQQEFIRDVLVELSNECYEETRRTGLLGVIGGLNKLIKAT